MDTVGFLLGHLASLTLLAAVAYGLGRRLTSRVRFAGAAEQLATCTALGLGTLGTVVFLLGVVHALYAGLLVGIVAAVAVVSLPTLAGDLAGVGAWLAGVRRRPAGERVLLAVTAALSAAVALVVLAGSLYPPILWDAVSYHLPVATAALREHALSPQSYLRFPVFPQLGEMMFALMLAVHDDVAAQLVSYLAAAVTAVALVAWGRRLKAPRAGAIGAAVWLGSPLVVRLAGAGYVDLILAAFIALAVFHFVRWWDGEGRNGIVLAGAFIGFAAGTKYTALVFGLMLTALAVYRCWRTRAPLAALTFMGVALLAGGGWYVRNVACTGNPLFPFASRLFGLKYWTDQDVALEAATSATDLPDRSVLGFLKLPLTLSFMQEEFSATDRLSPFPILLALLAVPLGLRRRQLRLPLGVATAFLVFWYASRPGMRYALAVLPLLALLAGVAVDFVVALAVKERAVAGGAVAMVVAIPLLAPGLNAEAARRREIGPLPTTSTERLRFLDQMPTFRCYDFLNALYGSSYRVIGADDVYMNHYAEGLRMGDLFGPARLTDISDRDAPTKLAALDRLKAGFFLHNPAEPFDLRLHDYVTPVFTCHNYDLYRVNDRPGGQALGQDVVFNGGFERSGGATPRGWDTFGTGTFESLPGRGGVARVPNRTGSVFEVVEVRPFALYRLGFWGQAAAPGCQAAVTVTWRDGSEHDIGTDAWQGPLSPEGGEQVLMVGSPRGAWRAVVAATVQGTVGAVFDDFSMRPVVRTEGGN